MSDPYDQGILPEGVEHPEDDDSRPRRAGEPRTAPDRESDRAPDADLPPGADPDDPEST